MADEILTVKPEVIEQIKEFAAKLEASKVAADAARPPPAPGWRSSEFVALLLTTLGALYTAAGLPADNAVGKVILGAAAVAGALFYTHRRTQLKAGS